ncbi:unnamed protein product [Sympodiomycopsis kandeliae]
MAYHQQQHPANMAAVQESDLNHPGAYGYMQSHGHHGPPQSQPLTAAYPGQTSYSADGTQAYTVDEYGRGTYWQLPPAPRLPVAAARGWTDYTHGHQQQNMPMYAPWSASTVPPLPPPPSQQPHAYHRQQNQVHALPSHYHQSSHSQPRHQVQPQQHHDIEQQMVMRHHMSMAQQQQQQQQQQESQQSRYSSHYNPAPPQYDPASAGAALPAHSQASLAGHAHQQQQLHTGHEYAPSYGGQAMEHAGTHGYDPHRPHSVDPLTLQHDVSQQVPYGPQQQQHQQMPVQHSDGRGTWYHDQASQPPLQQWQGPQGQAHHHSNAYHHQVHDAAKAGMQTAPDNNWTWPAHQSHHGQGQPYVQNQMHHDGRRQDSIPHTSTWENTSAHHDHRRYSNQVHTHPDPHLQHQHGQWAADHHLHSHHHGHPAQQSTMHVAGGQQQQQPLPAAHDHQLQQQQQQQQEAAAAAATKGPGPPSPDTLDKSGVPLSAFGAEIIWHACSVLSEPDILLEAHYDDRTCPSSGSSNSSPLINTPPTSPHSPSNNAKFMDATSSLMSSMELDPDTTISPGNDRMRSSSVFSKSRASGPLDYVDADRSGARSLRSSARSVKSFAESSPMQTMSPESLGASFSSNNLPEKKRLAPREGLSRTKSRERSRAAAVAVLAMVAPHLQWTVSEDKLPSLGEATAQSSAEAARRSHAQRSGSPRDPSLAFCGTGEVNPAFRRFAHQVLSQTLLSPTAFLLALLYALRVPLLVVDENGSVDPEALEVFASPPSAAPFKLFTLGLMIANKHLDDNTFLNKTWNEVTGIPLAELNRMEQYYLMRSNYEISLPEKTWISFLQAAKHREEAKLGSANLEKLQESMQASSSSSSFMRGHSATEAPRRRSAASEETSRRALIALDDILAASGSGIEPFHLPPQKSPSGETHKRHATPGGDSAGREEVGSWHGSKRPTGALHHHHQHCQSAPVSASHFKDSLSMSAAPAPARLDGGHSSCSPPGRSRGAFDAFARSLSDDSRRRGGGGGGVEGRRSMGGGDVPSWSSSTSCSISPSSSSSGTTATMMHDAPLAPCALLELLNSGRSLASAH